jgi:serine/threonine protein phosphatase PrpC
VGSGELALEVSARSDRGLVRVLNEDSYLAVPPVFLVADGMGGHAFGDQASQAIARTLEDRLVADRLPTVESVLAAVHDADRIVHGIGADDVAGSTLAGIALVSDEDDSPRWMAFNVGDSRIYRYDGELRQLTVDHSAVQELLDDGSIGPEEAASHPERNVITRAIGIGESKPDVWIMPFGADECFLICSDGLTKEVSDAQIADILALSEGEAHADVLVDAALASGGIDNVTAVVVHARLRPPAGAGAAPLLAHLEETLPRV